LPQRYLLFVRFGLGKTERRMIKVALLCDDCGAVIADGISANEVRLQAEALYSGTRAKICAWRARPTH
jgi:hypothetical protein